MLSPCVYGGENLLFTKTVDNIGEESNLVTADSILNSGESAQWDFIVFSVTDDTTFRRIDESTVYTLKKDGTIDGGGKWKIGYWNSDMEMGDGVTIDGKGFEQLFLGNGVSMLVELPGGVKADGVCAYGWDQDRKCQTVFFTGLTDKGIAVWGQRIPPDPAQ